MVDRRSTLPARRTRLIGRDRELTDLRNRVLHGDRRLVTVTGAGGVGKTALALEVGRHLEASMPDGAWFVDLTVVLDQDDVAIAWADALRIVDQSREPVETLVEHLATRQALIVLDNCEHLLPTLTETIDHLLDTCPDLRILATSRAPLRIAGESVFIAQPFDVPPLERPAGDVNSLASIPAIELFVERASAGDPSFGLTAATAPAIVSICRRLDGLPLAIELAAAQAGVFTPVEIDERLGLVGGLAGGNGRGAARQRTMEATLDWSQQMLGPAEQVVFRRLAVFAGGWTLAAAERVCSLGGDPSTVASSLATLVEHSLVVRDGDGPRSRYHMLAPIAEYAARRLASSGDQRPVGMAHAGFYLELTTRDFSRFGENLPEDLDRVATEHENCLAALRFAEQSGELPLRLGLIRNLLAFWRVRGHLRLGVSKMEAALEGVGDGSFERGMLLGVLAEYNVVLGDYDEAERQAREAEALFERLGHGVGQRTVIGILGLSAAARGEFELALAEYRRARPFVDALPGDSILAYWHAGVGRFELALGDVAAAERDLEQARDHFERAPAWYQGRVLGLLGVIARRTGNAARATVLLGAALASLLAYGATVEAIGCLEDVADVAVGQREWRRAATLLAASTSLRDATAATPTALERSQRDSDIDRVRRELDEPAFDDAWARGLGLSLEQAADVATAPAEADLARAAAPRGSVLTPREREIAELVALGLTNREIAERLVISTGTVRIHVERILGKLGRTSRVQVATWVVDEHNRQEPANTLPV